MSPRSLTAEDLWAFPRVGGGVPSPDGSRVIVPVTTYSLESNEGTTRLWMVDPGGDGARRRAAAEPQPLTSPEVSSSQPAFSPEGGRVALVRKPGGETGGKKKKGPQFPGQPQLYLLPLGGGEPERLTDLPLGVCDPQWFPDGQRVAFLAQVYREAPSLEETATRVKEKEDDPVKVAVTEERFYRLWDQWLTEGKIHHLFVLDLETRGVLDLTPDLRGWFEPDGPTGQYRIAPGGEEIAFAASRSRPPHDPLLWGVYTVKVPPRSVTRRAARFPLPESSSSGTGTAGSTRTASRAGSAGSPARAARAVRAGKMNLLTPRYPADAMRPIYSPDGRYIVFGMNREYDFYADRIRLVACDRKTGKHAILTEHWDRSPHAWEFTDDKTLVLQATDEAREALYNVDFPALLTGSGQTVPRRIWRGGTCTAPKPAGGGVFMTVSSLSSPPELTRLDLSTGQARRVTEFTRPHLEGIQLPQAEELYFTGAEGRKVQMFLLRPPGAGKGRNRLPLVHMIHGGPHGVFGDEWHWRWNAQAFAAPGYLVAMVNFHGSVGWGQDFAASILGRWGDQPYRDIMAATDLLIDKGLADPKRLAATGGSYGGYLVSWIASQTDRFAAIINHAGVCDFQTQYASDVTQGRARSMGGEPWENVAGMDRYNPMRYAAGFRSPMLVIHGEKDYRVPYAQGIEIYNVYKAMKLPARLVCYPDENHWILKPRNSLHWYGEVHAWLRRWLLDGGKAAAGAPRKSAGRSSGRR